MKFSAMTFLKNAVFWVWCVLCVVLCGVWCVVCGVWCVVCVWGVGCAGV